MEDTSIQTDIAIIYFDDNDITNGDMKLIIVEDILLWQDVNSVEGNGYSLNIPSELRMNCRRE